MKEENIRIAIVSPHYLQLCGLKAVLSDFFSIGRPDFFDDFRSFTESPVVYHRIFMDAMMYIANSEFFKDKKKIVLLSEKCVLPGSHPELSFLDVLSERRELTEALNDIIKRIPEHRTEENSKELSDREREVLELVTKGYTSKDIASELNISLYTVQAHRKNISGKLGIKSVSALTVYAMMNGIVSY
jgi:DNA-binding CsgD family transcriptional regulator